MMLYQFRKEGKRLVLNNFDYIKIVVRSYFTKPKAKAIFFDISETDTNRYLSNLIKFFKLNGYTIYLPKNKKLISTLCQKKGEFVYAHFILNGDVKIGMPKSKSAILLTREQISNDYFNAEFQNKTEIYHVPMSQYPLMYDNLGLDKNIDYSAKRKRSVFLAGNFNPLIYKNISTDGFFEILSRREIVDFIYRQEYYHKLSSFENLIHFIENSIDFKVLIIDTTKDFQIKTDKFKEVLKKFDFFMALPGVVIPQSHNLIESMAMGCIPFIHKTYADLFYPSLQHYKTAIVYETEQELDLLIKEAFNIHQRDLLLLRENVLQYYKAYLSPKAVVNAIVTNNYSKIIVQAEYVSLNLLKATT